MRRHTYHLLQRKQRQRGVALYVVAMVLMLAMLLALWTSRTSLFMEMLTSNSADDQRAFEAAQAMLQDAQHDIAMHLLNHPSTTTRSSLTPLFPRTTAQWSTWAQQMQQLPAPHCAHGLCLRRVQGLDFWANHNALMQMLAAGVRYGSYSGHHANDHPLLSEHTANLGAWYWIEPLLLHTSDSGNCTTSDPSPNSCTNSTLAFRITALAFGLQGWIAKSGRNTTMAVLQSVVIPTSTGNDSTQTLRTLSWRQMQ